MNHFYPLVILALYYYEPTGASLYREAAMTYTTQNYMDAMCNGKIHFVEVLNSNDNDFKKFARLLPRDEQGAFL